MVVVEKRSESIQGMLLEMGFLQPLAVPTMLTDKMMCLERRAGRPGPSTAAVSKFKGSQT